MSFHLQDPYFRLSARVRAVWCSLVSTSVRWCPLVRMTCDESHCRGQPSAEHRLAKFLAGDLDLGQQPGRRAVLVFGCAS